MRSDKEAKSQRAGTRSESSTSDRGRGRLRVIMLTHGGAEDALQRLVSLKEIEVVGVFVETEIARLHSVREKLRRSFRYDGYAVTMAKLIRRLFLAKSDNEDLLTAMQSRDELRNIAEAHLVPFHLVGNYHTPDSIALMRSTKADLGVIYGTNIVKESVFKIPRLGSINLHQGLAPYYRGGPPVFWELYNGESEIGLTVHYVETKVDSGAIILQDTMPLRYDYDYRMDYESFIGAFCGQLRVRCAELVAEAVRQIALGTVEPKPQDSRIGKRYRLPIKGEKDELRRRLRKRQKVSAARVLEVDGGRSDEASNA